jgi:PPM family protein phosphatase
MSIYLRVYGQTDVGRVRKVNEDSFVVADLSGGNLLPEKQPARFEVRERGVLLAVSDGMGGEKAGEVASAVVIESLRRSLAGQSTPPANDALFERAVVQANRDVWDAAHQPGREKMGATLTAVFVHAGIAYIAEVGDSRAYLVRGGEITQVTHDQSYVQLLLDAGVIKPEEADKSPFRSVILQAMGQKPDVSVALGKLELRQRDCFVLCSDGLSNKVEPEELKTAILTSPNLPAACNKLVALANERGGEDNITLIVAGVGGDLPPCRAGESVADTLEILKEFEAPLPH